MTKKKGDSIFCVTCGKHRTSHNFYNGIIIHERDDAPKDMIYFINEDADYTNSFKFKKQKSSRL